VKNLSIAKQLSLGFGVVLVMLAATLLFSCYQQIELADITQKQYRHPYTVTNAVARADANSVRIERGIRDVVLAESAAEVKARVDEMAEFDRLMVADLELGRERFLGDKAEFDALLQKVTQWRPIRANVIALKLAGKTDEAKALMNTVGAAKRQEISVQRKKLYDQASKKAEFFQVNATQVRDSAIQLTIGLGVVTLILGVAISVLVIRTLTRAINQAVDVARQVAAGDLSVRITVQGKSEIARLLLALKDMQTSLANVVREVRSGSEGVSTASSEIATGNHDLSARTETQAGALQQTAASMDQLGATVRQNAENAAQADQLAKRASEVAVKGGGVVAEVVDTMKGITEASRKIGDIISVIDGIAFQTNILALNAAVEAARAGEQGRGFAVVASEVRSLAGRSAEAAREIKSLITNSTERVEAGALLADQAGSTMSEVVQSIQRVTAIMAEISAATREQSSGVTEVGAAVTQMDQATQQNSALVEEMAAAASSLKSQARSLVETVSVFRLSAQGA
jgi:methyl-accepting chemotaxis protein